MTLTELIAALEAATEGSEALDIAITELFHPVGERGSYTPYTRSLDAALTLVPEGWEWVASSLGPQEARYRAETMQPNIGEGIYCSEVAQTPALALCIAALKARQS